MKTTFQVCLSPKVAVFAQSDLFFLPKPGVTKNFQNAIEKRVFNIFQRVRVRLKAEIPYFTIHKEKNGKNFEKKFCSVFSEKSWSLSEIRPKFSNKCCFLATTSTGAGASAELR